MNPAHPLARTCAAREAATGSVARAEAPRRSIVNANRGTDFIRGAFLFRRTFYPEKSHPPKAFLKLLRAMSLKNIKVDRGMSLG
jgi:hypothetical protein